MPDRNCTPFHLLFCWRVYIVDYCWGTIVCGEDICGGGQTSLCEMACTTWDFHRIHCRLLLCALCRLIQVQVQTTKQQHTTLYMGQ